jgi:outer membrane protein OmpA-like peptidoglycan-associated protein
MHPRVYIQALIATSIVLSSPAKAQDECTKLIIYAINQFCSMLPNGQNLCQPVALTGPSPACEVPAGTQLKPIPLAAPSLQMPQGYPFAYNPAPFTPYSPPYSPFPPTAFPGYVPPQFALPQFTAPQFASPQFAMPQGFVPMPALPVAPAPQPAPMVAEAPKPVTVETPSPAPAEPAPEPAPAATPVAESIPAVIAEPAAEMAVAPPASEPAPVQASPAPVSVQTPEPSSSTAPASSMVEDALAHFAFDSAELTEVGRATLEAWLAHAPLGMPVVVAGYADRLGPEPYNLRLSQQRAEAARNYLIAKGKDARDIRILAKGEANPVKRCKGGPTPTTKDCLAPNRRVEITPE